MSLILAMFMFALTMSISPGPVNMVIISSGANHGFRKTLPFISGATTGFTLLLILVGFGFYAVIDKYPLFFNYLNIAGSAFIIYLGYKIAASAPELSEPATQTMLMVFIIIYFLVCYISLAAWAVLGNNVSILLNNAQRIRVFNVLMGVLLIVTACYMLSFQ